MTRARLKPADTGLIARQIEASPFVERVRALRPSFAEAAPETVTAILDEAARFADAHLEALNEEGDRLGCSLDGGRVKTAPAHAAVWRAFAQAGWIAMDMPVSAGGQALPQFLVMAVQEIFDRSCTSFGMMPVPARSATRLLDAFGGDILKAEWLPRLCSGEWAATICISEAEAGSDVPRMRTRAERDADGMWRVTGEKQWISFGDQDLTSRIGHCLLARTEGAKGLSLFLVPDRLEDGERNGIAVRRIEEKLGLHMSATCALGFEGSLAHLVGEEGRGLAQMFVMITNMRIAVGVQGVAAASGAFDVAFGYAHERRQGGTGATPSLLAEHQDIQRMLLDMAARTDVLRGIGLALCTMADLAAFGEAGEEAEKLGAIVRFLLPVFKTVGGETGFELAGDAIQILGGAGFTREWPAEQILRDAKVLTIFEGTSGIQALDLLERRLRREQGLGLRAFLDVARADPSFQGGAREALAPTYDLLEQAASALSGDGASEAGALPFLRLSGLAAMGWIAGRLAALDGDDPAATRLRRSGATFLVGLSERAAACFAEIESAQRRVALFGNSQIMELGSERGNGNGR
ncbi:MAG TPA: acyl-CoA dehydrogenase family protein [Allosphingosinicella sp.]|nr:acyl-CoA dehydrogenase family protein [Allosphingosinicella sp.]